MLKYFILAVLCLILYQFFHVVLEGLEGENSSSEEDTGVAAAPASTSGDSTTTTTNNNNCGLSLTDRNVFLLNDRVNALQTQYTDMSGNIALLNRQMEDLMKQNENAASNMVGNEPLDISTGGNDMPQAVGGEEEEQQQVDTSTSEVAN